MTSQVNDRVTIKRTPRVNDAVVSLSSGRRYIVDRIYRVGSGTRVEFYGVESVDNPNHPNAFKPGEIAVLDRYGQNAAHADYVKHGGVY
jgi:hypothetical protein